MTSTSVLFRYPNLTMTWMSSLTNSYGFDFHGKPERSRRLGVYFHGVNGTLYANYSEHRIIPEGDYLNPFIRPEVAARKQAPDYANRVLYSAGELKPVSDKIRFRPATSANGSTRQVCAQPSCSPEYHCRIDVPLVLSLLSHLPARRSIRFDPETESIVGDSQAAELAVPTYRAPCTFPKQYLQAEA